MSEDEADVRPETTEAPAAQEAPAGKGKPWSAADRRLLLITIGGGLAANIGTVMVVGLAVAVDAILRHHYGRGFPHAIIGLSILIAIVLVGQVVATLSAWGKSKWPISNSLIVGLIAALLVLILLGLADGIK